MCSLSSGLVKDEDEEDDEDDEDGARLSLDGFDEAVDGKRREMGPVAGKATALGGAVTEGVDVVAIDATGGTALGARFSLDRLRRTGATTEDGSPTPSKKAVDS